ncbi:MAG: hypothetical protein GOP50_04195 [Candidatus Heimdallarchaeota archaeon]|nr:hypothetical protein [Candidatus Heimdallarchaeota archaeon]
MENIIIVKLKDFINKIDRAAGIQLVMIFMTLVAFIILLYIQKYLPSFEGSQTKLIIVDILLGVGLLIEFGYFIWHTNKQGKEESTKKAENKESTAENSVEIENLVETENKEVIPEKDK